MVKSNGKEGIKKLQVKSVTAAIAAANAKAVSTANVGMGAATRAKAE